MKKILLFTVLSLSALLCFSQGETPDWARKTGSFGIGGNTSLGVRNFTSNDSFIGDNSSRVVGLGLNVRTFITPQFGLEMILTHNIHTTTHEFNGGEWSSNTKTIGAGVHGIYKLAYWERGHLSAIFGVGILDGKETFSQTGQPDHTSDVNDIIIGLGLRGEYFPTQFFSFNQAGTSGFSIFIDADIVDIVNSKVNDVKTGSEVIVFGAGDTFGSAGFTVWFN